MTAPLGPPRHVVVDAVARAIAEDVGPLGDLTAALIPLEAHGIADIVARRPGVLAGTACVIEAFAQIDPTVDVELRAPDGDLLAVGTVIGTVAGSLRAILTGERTALNFLCHLSGVATATRAFVDALGGRARVVETRKTLPGLRALEKAAVRAGGGVNHRGSLSDMVLVKDNHLGALGIGEAVRVARDLWPGRGVEVECERAEQVALAIEAGADLVMLDNMTTEQMVECVRLVRDGPRAGTLIEVSGGVTLENVAAIAGIGVDLVSTSGITQSAPALDIALDLRIN